jgi:hypothetical protein
VSAKRNEATHGGTHGGEKVLHDVLGGVGTDDGAGGRQSIGECAA